MATATVLLPILGCSFDASSPPGIDYSNSRPKLLFDPDTDEIVYWTFRMPSDYASSPVLKIQFSMASAVAGSVVWACVFMAVTPGDVQDMDADSYDAANTDTEAVPGTAGYLDEASIAVGNADALAAGDFLAIKMYRDADNGSDNASGDAEAWAVSLEYTTT